MSASYCCLLLLLLANVTLPAFAQKHFFGPCPTPAVVAPFDSTAFAASSWYEVRRYHSWLEKGTKCVQWAFAEISATSMTATTTMKHWIGYTKTMVATLTQKDAAADSADFSYVITDLPGPLGPLFGTYDYQILAYNAANGYAVAWSCKNHLFNLSNEQLLWVFTTTRTPTAAVTDAAIAAITSAGLNTNKLQTTVQTGC